MFLFKRYGINLEPKQPTVVHYGQTAGNLIQESADFHFYLFHALVWQVFYEIENLYVFEIWAEG